MAFSACRPLGQRLQRMPATRPGRVDQSIPRVPRAPQRAAGIDCSPCGPPAMARHARRASNAIKQPHAENNIVGNRAIRLCFDPATGGTVGSSLSRPRMARISGRWGIRIDAARFATEKPDPHRPAASSNLRGQADGTWARFPGPKPASVMARHLARQAQQPSYQLQARFRWAVWHRTPGHPTPPPRSRRNHERPQLNGRTPLGGARSGRLSHPGRIRTSGMP
jgi:hypothetical protein